MPRLLAAAWTIAGLLLLGVIALVDVPNLLRGARGPAAVSLALAAAGAGCAALALHAAWLEARGRAVVAWRVLPALMVLALYAMALATGSGHLGASPIVAMAISPFHWGYLLLAGCVAYALVLGLRALARRASVPRATGE